MVKKIADTLYTHSEINIQKQISIIGHVWLIFRKQLSIYRMSCELDLLIL